MISSSPLLSSLAASLARYDLHFSISAAVASPRRRIDFSRFISSRLENPFAFFAGGLVSVEVAMRPSPWSQAGRRDEAKFLLSVSRAIGRRRFERPIKQATRAAAS